MDCFPSARVAQFDAFGNENVSSSFQGAGNCLKSPILVPQSVPGAGKRVEQWQYFALFTLICGVKRV